VGFAVDAQPTAALAYEEIPVTVGEGTPNALNGLITLPTGIEEGKTVPGCVLVHDAGALDMNAAVGATHFFEDLAHELADMGIASIRYDKRTYTYGESEDMTVQTEVLEDASLALQLLAGQEAVMDDGIVLIGHGFGAHMVPFVAAENKEATAAMILIGSRPIDYAEQLLQKTDFSSMTKEEGKALKEFVAYIGTYSEEQVRSMQLFGKNAYYFWDLEQKNHINQIMRLAVPTYIVQGRNDADATEDDGWRAYAEELKNYGQFVDYNSYRGLNHLLANDLSVDENGRPQYAHDAGIDVPAVRDLADWLFSQLPAAETTEVEQ
jgi:dienelactone hydrolase